MNRVDDIICIIKLTDTIVLCYSWPWFSVCMVYVISSSPSTFSTLFLSWYHGFSMASSAFFKIIVKSNNKKFNGHLVEETSLTFTGYAKLSKYILTIPNKIAETSETQSNALRNFNNVGNSSPFDIFFNSSKLHYFLFSKQMGQWRVRFVWEWKKKQKRIN